MVLPGRWRVLRLLGFALVYLLVETVGLAVALVLWLASGLGWWLHAEWSVRAHYAVLRLVLAAVVGSARLLFGLRIVDDEVGWSPLDDGVPGLGRARCSSCPGTPGRATRCCSCTRCSAATTRAGRASCSRTCCSSTRSSTSTSTACPTRSCAPAPTTATARVGRLAEGLGDEDALLIFPEGGNFSEGRRRRAIDRLRMKGMEPQAAAAERLRHLLPPRPGGVAAAVASAPHADVVLVAHTGLEHLSTAADLWDGLPMDSTVRMRWWFVPAAEVPREPRAARALAVRALGRPRPVGRGRPRRRPHGRLR